MTTKILLLDDDLDYLGATTEYLGDHGYLVFPASSYNQATKIVKEQELDLAIVDVSLDSKEPLDTEGIEFVFNEAPLLPKIVITAHPNFKLAVESLKKRFDDVPSAIDYLAKAEGEERLLAAIETAVAGHVAPKKKAKRVRQRAAIVIHLAIAVIALFILVGCLQNQGANASNIIYVIAGGLAAEVLSGLMFRLLPPI